jgi:ribosomal protein L37E
MVFRYAELGRVRERERWDTGRREDRHHIPCDRCARQKGRLYRVQSIQLHDPGFMWSIKYTKQEMLMVQETPEVYDRIVKPYIAGFPKSRTQWLVNVLGV